MCEYDPHHSSIFTAGNGGTKPALAAFTIFYNQGAEKYQLEQTLQPDEQMWIDVGKLIREHVPDKNGKTLPEDLTSGSYEIRDLTGSGLGTLFEGKITYDKTYGHAAYGCATCCDFQRPNLELQHPRHPLQGHLARRSDSLSAVRRHLHRCKQLFRKWMAFRQYSDHHGEL
jgi:hypothetical protein